MGLISIEHQPETKRIHLEDPITPTTTPESTPSRKRFHSGSESSDIIFGNETMLGPMLVKKLSEKARIPTRGSKYAAGFDLYSAAAMKVPAQSQCLVPIDISIAVPEGTYARVAPRSGLALKHFVDVGAGVVDYDYRGPLGVVLFNFGSKEFEVQEGDRIAQLILEKVHICEAFEVKELDTTERGSGGFGSTGVKSD